ncbi:MAG: hypothetical protein V7746_21255 [Halioglobus sp.]
MKNLLLAGIFICIPLSSGAADAYHYRHNADFLSPPVGQDTIGDGHGDIAVSASGDIYVSVQGGERPGVQIYGPDGKYKSNLEGAASDFHGFRIHRDRNGVEYLYATELKGERLVKWTLDGKLVLAVAMDESVPSGLQARHFLFKGVRLTGIAISSDDRIFVTDGYGSSRIHEFDQQGHYVRSIAGKSAPYNFSTAHKVIVDRRFSPERLLVTDRENNRLVWLDFEGNLLTEHGGLRLPSALAIQGDLLAVAELDGRITVLDKTGTVVATLGTNNNPDQISTPKVKPGDWRAGTVTSPHGVTFDLEGNILVTEWNEWGRVLEFVREAPQ